MTQPETTPKTPAERLKELEAEVERYVELQYPKEHYGYSEAVARLETFKEALALVAANVPAEGELTDWELAIEQVEFARRVTKAASAKMAAIYAARYGAVVTAAQTYLNYWDADSNEHDEYWAALRESLSGLEMGAV